MPLQTDRTLKALLIVIAGLLAALLLKPVWPTSQAFAQTAAPTPAPPQAFGFRLTEVGSINVPRGANVREMHVVDSAQALIVRLDDKINIYRVDKFFLPINTTK